MINPTSYIELDRSAVRGNLVYLKNVLGDKTKYSSVVKGNAYGHGIEPFVAMQIQEGVNHFSVFSAQEAFRVHPLVTEKKVTVMILGFIGDEEMEWVIENKIEFYVFNLSRLELALSICKKINRKAHIHLELETGMNRTGLAYKELNSALEIIKENSEYFKLCGICTHFAGAESISNYFRIQNQFKKFQRWVKKVDPSDDVILHTACSAAALRFPKSRMDMVRLGILQYGYFPSKEVLIDLLTKRKIINNPLKPVLSWKSVVMDIKKVKAGEYVGYGTSYLTNSDMTIAIIPMGYGYGFTRSLSNQGRVLINGNRYAVVGTVNMNMVSVDITSDEHIRIGDEVVLIGKQGDIEINVASFSESVNQVNYELLTRLPADIPRIIKE